MNLFVRQSFLLDKILPLFSLCSWKDLYPLQLLCQTANHHVSLRLCLSLPTGLKKEKEQRSMRNSVHCSSAVCPCARAPATMHSGKRTGTGAQTHCTFLGVSRQWAKHWCPLPKLNVHSLWCTQFCSLFSLKFYEERAWCFTNCEGSGAVSWFLNAEELVEWHKLCGPWEALQVY